MDGIKDLPPEVQRELEAFVAAAEEAWGDRLVSVVLYGSAAEGRLRATSDVNVLLVLEQFDRERVDRIREPYRAARAAIRLSMMLILRGELTPALDAFAVKFDDILSRYRLLHGEDPFSGLQVSPEATLRRLQQVLLNLLLRLRERYALLSLRQEQLAVVAADVSGPLRSCAATLLRLEGQTAESPKAALETVVRGMGEPRLEAALAAISAVREHGRKAAVAVDALVLDLMELVERLQARARELG